MNEQELKYLIPPFLFTSKIYAYPPCVATLPGFHLTAIRIISPLTKKYSSMKHLMIQSDFRNLQDDFTAKIGTAVHAYHVERIEIMIRHGITPNDLRNDYIEHIKSIYDKMLAQPF